MGRPVCEGLSDYQSVDLLFRSRKYRARDQRGATQFCGASLKDRERGFTTCRLTPAGWVSRPTRFALEDAELIGFEYIDTQF